jgi:peptide chain release factor 2
MLTLHSGAGGTESDDWVRILFRMYSRWAEKKGYTLNILDFLPGEVVGMKYVTLEILGENASGYLKSETGVHRLIRISPFDSSAKRHTTFASCSVIPLLENDLDKIDIRPEDIRVDTYRSSGSGGQHVNTTDSAVRITHIPTNIVAQCQSDRSQYKNKEVALKILKNKLLQLKEKEKFDSMAHIREEEKDISWGSQIRTYVFNPYSMVKDHRTNKETANINAVLDGDIDDFINAYLERNIQL